MHGSLHNIYCPKLFIIPRINTYETRHRIDKQRNPTVYFSTDIYCSIKIFHPEIQDSKPV